MSSDPLLHALATLDQPAPDATLDTRTQRAVQSRLGRKHLRYAGVALGVVLAFTCVTYLAVLVVRASSLF